MYPFDGNPYAPNPVTSKTLPVYGSFSLSSLLIPTAAVVTYNVEKSSPPKQQEETCRLGMATD